MTNYLKSVWTLALTLSLTLAFGQEASIVKLEQVPGKFTTEVLTLKADQPYVFEVLNKGVDHKVGFVIAPKGKETDQNSYVAASFLSKTIKDGEKASSKVVNLPKGEYSYYCPMNPTPYYTLRVE